MYVVTEMKWKVIEVQISIYNIKLDSLTKRDYSIKQKKHFQICTHLPQWKVIQLVCKIKSTETILGMGNC